MSDGAYAGYLERDDDGNYVGVLACVATHEQIRLEAEVIEVNGKRRFALHGTMGGGDE